MVPYAPAVVASSSVFRLDWKTLVRLAYTRSNALDLDTCPASTSLCRFCSATDKPKTAWFWGSNQETVTVVLRHKPGNRQSRFWGQTVRNRCSRLWGQTTAADFETKLVEIVIAGFEAKPTETIPVVLRPNHWQTVAIGFEAQTDEKPSEWFWGQTTHKPPRNSRYSSPCAQCIPHTDPSDLSITQPPSTRPVRPSPIICTWSPTPVTMLVATRHAAHATCTPRDKQIWFSKRNKDKRKTKRNYPAFEFKHRQVNDSSQLNQGINHLISQMIHVCLPTVSHKFSMYSIQKWETHYCFWKIKNC
jgi:hypothetical protein